MKSVILFSNKAKIERILSDDYLNLFSNITLSTTEFIVGYNKDTRKFESVTGDISKKDSIFIMFDNDTNGDKYLDIIKSKLVEIKNESSDLLIIWHTTPSPGIKSQIRDLIPCQCIEALHDINILDSYYTQVYRALNSLLKGIKPIPFFNIPIICLQDMIDVIFKRLDKTKDANIFLQYLSCCMSKETIKANSGFIENLDIFPKEIHPKINKQLDLMKVTDFKEPCYQKAFMEVCCILDGIHQSTVKDS